MESLPLIPDSDQHFPVHIATTADRNLLLRIFPVAMNHGICDGFAQRDFDKAVTDDPSHAEARFGRGQASLRWQRYPDAIADFTFALDNHYPPARALHGLAVAQLKTGHRESARANLVQSLKHSTNQEVQKLLEQLDQLADSSKNPDLPTDRAREIHP